MTSALSDTLPYESWHNPCKEKLHAENQSLVRFAIYIYIHVDMINRIADF